MSLRLFSISALSLFSVCAFRYQDTSTTRLSADVNTTPESGVVACRMKARRALPKTLAPAVLISKLRSNIGTNAANYSQAGAVSNIGEIKQPRRRLFQRAGIERNENLSHKGARMVRPANSEFIVDCNGRNDTATLTAAITAASGAPIVIMKGQRCVSNDITIPNLRIEEGGLLLPVTSHTITLSGNFEAGRYQTFANALPGQGTVSFTGKTAQTEIVPQLWGATGNGISDDTGALNQAFAQAGQTIFVPKGSYKTSATLASPVCATIYGAGRDSTIFIPGPAVKVFMKIYNGVLMLRGFQVDGAATANANGLLFGDAKSFMPWGGQVEMVRIKNFRGPSGVGVRIADALKSSFLHVTVEGCGIDLLVKKIAASYPTTITFRNCQFNTATTKGVDLVDAHYLTFDGCVFESNGEEGVVLLPDAGGALESVAFVNGCWFEDNYRGNNKKYQFVAGDGTGLGQATIRPVLRDIYFAGDAGTAKAININGSAVAGFIIDDAQVPNFAEEIKIQNDAYGVFSNFPSNLNISLVVSNTSGFAHVYGRGQIRFPVKQNPASNPNTLDDYREGVFTPTLVLGGGSVTYSKQTGSFTKIGRLVTVQILVTINVATRPSGSLEVRSLPFLASAEQKGAVSILGEGLLNTVGTCLVGTIAADDSAIRVYRFESGTLANAGPDMKSGTTLSITATYEANDDRP